MPLADKKANRVNFIRQFLDFKGDKGGYKPGNRWFISANTRPKTVNAWLTLPTQRRLPTQQKKPQNWGGSMACRGYRPTV